MKAALPLCAALALAACGKPASDDGNAVIDNSANAAVGADIETLPPDEEVMSGNFDADGNLSTRDNDTVGGMPLPPDNAN